MSYKLLDKKFEKSEKIFLAGAEVDYVALAEIVGIVMGNKIYNPNERGYLKALKFIKYLMDKYGKRLKCLKGVNLQQVNMNNEEFIEFLKSKWYAGRYKDVDFGVWFELEEEN